MLLFQSPREHHTVFLSMLLTDVRRAHHDEYKEQQTPQKETKLNRPRAGEANDTGHCSNEWYERKRQENKKCMKKIEKIQRDVMYMGKKVCV